MPFRALVAHWNGLTGVPETLDFGLPKAFRDPASAADLVPIPLESWDA